ncbi:nuclease-related domain-containing protein [Plasticicumulans acidivorans]|uniref:Nuclease-like protein n=1 Tax=Plasticicumulans acidivorans TaxID=886464 RepID=A0A317MVE8_9GAMM|nr:nuclease-related domain-containing protein [Plasticicumulans acidivorans]PWV62227.1 nuclease-like protein [Plasticicumulans acidivorans]
MDTRALLTTTLLSVAKSLWPLLLVAVLVGLYRLFRPQIKGWFGEYLVYRSLLRELPAAGYRVLHDVTLALGAGDTTQIDYIVIGPGGVTVIETKHFSGWLFGDAREAQWTQVIYRHKTRFQNPFRQHWKHVQALRERYELPAEAVHSAVVLLGCEWKASERPQGLSLSAGERLRGVRAQPAGGSVRRPVRGSPSASKRSAWRPA